MWLEGEDLMEGTPAEELLDVYLLAGHRVIALASHLPKRSPAGWCGCPDARGPKSWPRRFARWPPSLGSMSPRTHRTRTRRKTCQRFATAHGARRDLDLMLAAGGAPRPGRKPSRGRSIAPATFQVLLTEFAISPPMIRAPTGEPLSFR
jgi:hypothetical protein